MKRADPWQAIVGTLMGSPTPPIPERAGRIYECHDEPISDDDLRGADADEARRILGRTRAYAEQRLAEINSQPAPDGAQPEAQP